MKYQKNRISKDDKIRTYGSYYACAADEARLFAIEGELMDGMRISTRRATRNWCFDQWTTHDSRYTGFRPTRRAR